MIYDDGSENRTEHSKEYEDESEAREYSSLYSDAHACPFCASKANPMNLRSDQISRSASTQGGVTMPQVGNIVPRRPFTVKIGAFGP
jgi:hypothetical protein